MATKRYPRTERLGRPVQFTSRRQELLHTVAMVVVLATVPACIGIAIVLDVIERVTQ